MNPLVHRSSIPTVAYQDDLVTLYHGDCRLGMTALAPRADAIITDPPYGDTSLDWDRQVDGWLDTSLADTLWCFGSLRFFLDRRQDFTEAGWKLGQEIVWEKHNGSGFHADRFKRVHELAVHWYRGEWGAQHRDVPRTMDVTARTLRRKGRPAHTGHIEDSSYASEDGGPRLMRSVIECRSEHGRAVHPTQKPLGILRPLLTYSVPPGGTVIDPFAGSGSTLLAAREQGKRAVGFEISADYCAAAVQRLNQMEMVA